MDESRVTLALRFFLGDDDDRSLQIDVTRFDVPGFLWPTAGVPDEQEQIPEGVAFLNPSKDRLEVIRSHRIVAAPGHRLRDPLQRRRVDISHLLRPVARPLHGHDTAALVGVAPVLVGINPFDDVVGLQGGKRTVGLVAKVGQKAGPVLVVPLRRASRAMLEAPGKILAVISSRSM
jgi:hypothetical protein